MISQYYHCSHLIINTFINQLAYSGIQCRLISRNAQYRPPVHAYWLSLRATADLGTRGTDIARGRSILSYALRKIVTNNSKFNEKYFLSQKPQSKTAFHNCFKQHY